MSEITVDTEKVLKALEKIDKANAELRAILAPGVFREVPREQRTQPPKDSSAPMVLDHIDVSQIPFKIKGGEPARDSDGFAYTFPKDREGKLWDSSVELYNAIIQYGKIRIGKFVYQLSKDEVFIQRVVFKE
ncbi:hypothetical protein ES703_32580 [subsurface metagenome]